MGDESVGYDLHYALGRKNDEKHIFYLFLKFKYISFALKIFFFFFLFIEKTSIIQIDFNLVKEEDESLAKSIFHFIVRTNRV